MGKWKSHTFTYLLTAISTIRKGLASGYRKEVGSNKVLERQRTFRPKALLEKVADGSYDWDDLQRLVRRGSLPSPEDLVKAVLTEYSYLENLDKQLLEIA